MSETIGRRSVLKIDLFVKIIMTTLYYSHNRSNGNNLFMQPDQEYGCVHTKCDSFVGFNVGDNVYMIYDNEKVLNIHKVPQDKDEHLTLDNDLREKYHNQKTITVCTTTISNTCPTC